MSVWNVSSTSRRQREFEHSNSQQDDRPLVQILEPQESESDPDPREARDGVWRGIPTGKPGGFFDRWDSVIAWVLRKIEIPVISELVDELLDTHQDWYCSGPDLDDILQEISNTQSGRDKHGRPLPELTGEAHFVQDGTHYFTLAPNGPPMMVLAITCSFENSNNDEELLEEDEEDEGEEEEESEGCSICSCKIQWARFCLKKWVSEWVSE